MKFKNIKGWDLKQEIEGLLFFAQRMNELLWDFTLDSYKPPSLNAPSLCKEAIDLISDIELGLILEKNLEAVLEELIFSVRNDPVARSLLDLPIENYVSVSEGTKLADQKLRLEVLGQTLEQFRYLHRCFDHLTIHVEKLEKRSIDLVATTMVTSLLNMGMSKRHLAEKTNAFFFSAETKIESVRSLKQYIQSIYPYAHNFDLYFLTSSLIEEVRDSLPPFKLRILDEIPEELAKIANDSSFHAKAGQVYVHVGGLQGLDAYSAFDEAFSKLDAVSDLFTLFHHRKKIDWESRAIVVQCCIGAPVLVNMVSGPMTKSFDLKPEKASKELNNLLRNLNLKGAGFHRFKRVADLHGTCVQSDVPENQLVNLWTSLETLIPSHAGNSKIINIVNSSMPFLLSPYIWRLVQRVSHDLVLWKPWKIKSILNRIDGISGPNAIKRTLALLCLKKYGELRNELYAELGDYHLLRFRVYCLSKIFSSPTKIKELIDMHERKIRWQFHRLYRTRNLIVHSGRKPSYLNSLIENGHEYLDQIMFSVMKLSCGEYRVRSLEQAFELAKVRHRSFEKKLKEVTEFTSENCHYLCVDMDPLLDSSLAAWGEDADSGQIIALVDRRKNAGAGSGLET